MIIDQNILQGIATYATLAVAALNLCIAVRLWRRMPPAKPASDDCPF